MYNKGAVLIGIIVFLGLMTSPFWLNAGKEHKELKLEKPKLEKKCVEPASWMRAGHMKMLNDWRHEVVRSEERKHKSSETGKEFNKSLTLTCLDCHEKKKEFCDKCHTYAGVTPYCWECHVVPEEKI
jgi:hypothetical protein